MISASLEIGKYIYSKLTSACPDVKVYPIVAENGAQYPFMVYRRIELASGDSKDGLYEDTAKMEVVIVSDKYSEGLDLAKKVREAIELEKGSYGQLEVNDAILSLATEEYNDAFIQKLQFDMKLS